MARRSKQRPRTIKELEDAYPAAPGSLDDLFKAKTRLDAEILAREWHMITVTAPLGIAAAASLFSAIITTLPTFATAPEAVRVAHAVIWALFALLAAAYSYERWTEQKHASWCLDRRCLYSGEIRHLETLAAQQTPPAPAPAPTLRRAWWSWIR